jgi:choline kinase
MNLNNYHDSKRITTALLLAAGTGSRLFPLTQDAPKCLTMVNETSILERLVIGLKQQGFKRLVIVTGYKENRIREVLGTKSGCMVIEYIYSPLYKTTNNIYSLWMVRETINEPFILIESDLIFDASLLDEMIYPDRIAVGRMQSWLNGTTVVINQSQHVKSFQNYADTNLAEDRYKTVNIYSFSLSSWHDIAERLDQYISAGKVNCYYETVLSEMVEEGSLLLQAASFDNKPWYEIDTIEDLAEAEKLFPAGIPETSIPENIILQTAYLSDQLGKEIERVSSKLVTGLFSELKPS